MSESNGGDLAKPIERPGVTVNKSLGELLNARSNSEANEKWQASMQDISEAEGRAFRAWANRDVKKLEQVEGFIAGHRTHPLGAVIEGNDDE